ncbi:MAG TPA: universal stress protein [Nitrospira sp.]|nr:universal stress protein [Nitrospira sp.]
MKQPLINRIVVATDFSECAERAVEYGIYFALGWSAHVDFISVVETLPGLEFDRPFADPLTELRRKESERLLGELAARVQREQLDVNWHVRHGIPSQEIVQAVLEQQADLLVVGTHGRTGLEDIMLGSTAERVIKQAPCPVLTVRACRSTAKQDATVPPHVRHVLAPVDFSSPSLDALEYAVQLVDGFGAKLTLLHVLEPIYYDLEFGLGRIEKEAEKRTHWEAQLDSLAQVVKERGLAASSMVLGGIPSESIRACAEQQGCDLIVMGTHGRRGLTRLRYGSAAEGVLRQAHCPVLTVRSPKFAPGHRRVVPQAMSEA